MNLWPATTPLNRRLSRFARRALAILAVGTSLVALATGCGLTNSHFNSTTIPLAPRNGNQQAISRANLNHLWPFTVNNGTITCRLGPQGADAIFIAPDGKAYALNSRASQDGYPSLGHLRNGTSLGAIRSLALALCEPSPG
ncbi:MAG: DUF2511 domain-containing protein [Acidimicrobiales bacterium]